MNSHYRIAMVETGGWGGIGHYAYNLSTALGDRGCEVSLITASPYELAELPRSFVLRDGLDSKAAYPVNLAAVVREVRRCRPQLVHIQSTLSARRDWLPLLGLRTFGLPVVLTVHNVLPHDREERDARFMQTAYRLLYRTADHLILHGRISQRQLAADFGVRLSRGTVIPHGDYTFADMRSHPNAEEARARLGLPDDGRVLLCFGALREYKGIPDLIQAFAASPIDATNAYLAIVGKPAGLDPAGLQRQIDRLGIGGRCILHPEYIPFPEIGLYFRAADAVVLPYRALTQSGALQLAYAFSKPVIVTRVGALPETVEHGRNGYIVPPCDPQALAGAISDLLVLGDRRLMEMGQRSRELAVTQYSWAKIATDTERVYRMLLSTHHDSTRGAS